MVVKSNSFVRFLEEIEDTKKLFRNYLTFIEEMEEILKKEEFDSKAVPTHAPETMSFE